MFSYYLELFLLKCDELFGVANRSINSYTIVVMQTLKTIIVYTVSHNN